MSIVVSSTAVSSGLTFLQLVNRLKHRCGVVGADLTSVIGQPASYNRLIDWVNEAWMDIQLRRVDWDWLVTAFSFATVQAQATYTDAQAGITNLSDWKRDSMRNYLTASGTPTELFLPYMPYEMWRDLYQFGANRTTYTRPNVMSITPGKALALGPVPTSGYTIVGEYYAIPTELTLLTDIPRLPSQYHMAIVYRAMMFYGAFEAASEVFSLGQSEFNKMINRLESQYLPEIEVAGSDV